MSKKTWEQGNGAEVGFVESCKKNGIFCVPSSRQENMMGHFDFRMLPSEKSPISLGIKVEVKSAKRLRRHDTDINYDVIYVEFLNVNGDKGWLYGQADYFAFQRPVGFCLVKKQKLIGVAEALITKEWANKPTLYKSYKRYDRPAERVGLILFSDVSNFSDNVLLT